MRVDEAPGLRGCVALGVAELAPRRGLHPAAFLRHRRITPLFASRMKQKKDHEGRQRGQVRASSHPCTWVGRGAPSGLIKPFELDRRKQSEDSIEPAVHHEARVPSKSQETGPRPPPARPRTQPSFPQLVRGRREDPVHACAGCSQGLGLMSDPRTIASSRHVCLLRRRQLQATTFPQPQCSQRPSCSRGGARPQKNRV